MPMKKLLTTVALLFIFSFVFAEKYTVVQIQGKAHLKDGAIVTGQELDSEAIITIKGFRDYIKLNDNKSIYGPVINKKVAEVVSGPKLKKGKIVSVSAVAPDVKESRPGVSTAASRASDAKEDLNWEE